MKRIIRDGFAFMLGLSCGTLCYVLFSKQHNVPKGTKTVHIAICSPVSHPAIADIENGCIQTLLKSTIIDYQCQLFNANGSLSLMRAQIDEAVAGTFDAIITIGANATQLAKEITAKKQIHKPIVFCGIDKALSAAFAAQSQDNMHNITGVSDEPNYQEQFDLLVHLKPEIKKILLVCSPAYGPSLEADIKLIEGILQEKEISLQQVHVLQSTELQAKVAPFIADADVLLILKDHTTVTGIDTLIKLCNKHGVTLYASDLNSCPKGAVMAYGIKEYDSGKYAAKKICLIIEQGKKPHEIPISTVPDLSIAINKQQMEQQGLTIDHATLTLIEHGSIINQKGTA